MSDLFQVPESLSPREKWVRDNDISVAEHPDNPLEKRHSAGRFRPNSVIFAATRSEAIDGLADALHRAGQIKHYKNI